MIIHLLGFPGVGKNTIANEMSVQASSFGKRLVVVDNHLTSNPVLSVIGASGSNPLPDGVWDRVRKIREVVYQSIEDLSPRDWSFVFTNVIVDSDPHGLELVNRLEQIAVSRESSYTPVMLRCDVGELRLRAGWPGRAERHKWADPDAVESFATHERLLQPGGGAVELDVTGIAARDSAAWILRRVGLTERQS